MLYETGAFKREDTIYVWYILIGSTVGLLAVTLGRLYSSAFYALRDPKTPLRFAILRVCLTAVLGVLFAFPLRAFIVRGIELLHMHVPQLAEGTVTLGAIGLTASAGVAGWIEFILLRRALNRRIGRVQLDAGFQIKLWLSALAGAATGVAVDLFVAPRVIAHLPHLLTRHHLAEALLVAGSFGIVYFIAAIAMGVPEARATLRRFI